MDGAAFECGATNQRSAIDGDWILGQVFDVIRLGVVGACQGVFAIAQAANAVMQQQDDGGVIINIGSLSGRRPSPNSSAYGAAKAGLANLTGSLAMEWAPKVRVNNVTVGYLETEKAELFYGDAAGVAAVGETVPMKRMARPGDVVGACLFLASPAAAFITGADIAVHGGGEPPPFLSAAQHG